MNYRNIPFIGASLLLLSFNLMGCAQDSLIPTGAISAEAQNFNDSGKCIENCIGNCASNTTCTEICLKEKCVMEGKQKTPVQGITGATSYS